MGASAQHDGVLWAHNDSGSSAGIYSIGPDGEHLGFFSLAGIDAVDVEDMALVDKRIYLGDIGDNNRRRESVQIYVFDEPSPSPGGEGAEVAGPVEIIDARYPDGPTDAEAILVDPLTGEILLLSKDLDDGEAPTRLYAVPTDNETEDTVQMELVGAVDINALSSQSTEFSISAVLFPGQVTAADSSRDGRVIALRTYGTVWLFPRRADQTMAEALAGVPCEGGTAAEGQGESIAFLPAGEDDHATTTYATVSEGTAPPLNIVTVELR